MTKNLFYPVLPFPHGTLASELILLTFLTLLESIRLFAGWKANLTENVGGMSLCVALYVPGILGVLYFLIWQVRCKSFYTEKAGFISTQIFTGLHLKNRIDLMWNPIDNARS